MLPHLTLPHLTPNADAGRWRVNVDIRHRTVTSRPDVPPHDLIAVLQDAGVPTAVIDLDRSMDRHRDLTFLAELVRQWPGALWLGGRLGDDPADLNNLLDAGAAGVIIGSVLYCNGAVDKGFLRAVTQACPARQLLISLDVADDIVLTHGFTARTGLSARLALDTIAETTGRRCQVLYVDATASQRGIAPSWRRVAAVAHGYGDVLDLWYAGGVSTWDDVSRLWRLGLSAVVGRAYLTGDLGLDAR